MTYNFLIPDMTCEHCKKRIISVIEESGGTVDALDLETKLVAVTSDLQPEKLVALIDEAGYTAEVQQ